MHRLWAEYFLAGDVDGLLSLYEKDAAFVAQSGAFVTGHRAIREVLTGFISVRRTFELDLGRAIQTGDLALMVSSWRLTGVDRGAPYETNGRTADVLRRQADGGWLIVIDSPYGEGA